MKEFELRRSQRFVEPLEEIFGFFADPMNLAEITPPWLRFQIRSARPIEMRLGARIDYRLSLRGLPMKWQSEITAWEPPHRFVDEQRVGPYRRWVHEHRFRERDGLTEVSDTIRFSLLGGEWMYRMFVASDLEMIFDYRRETLGRRFTEVRTA